METERQHVPSTRTEPGEIVGSFQQQGFYMGFQSDFLQSHAVVEIPSAVLTIMEQLRCDLEVKFGGRKSDSKMKFMGRTKKNI